MFFYPTKSLIFPKALKLTIFKGLNIPNMEFEVYRAQARKFVSKMSDAPNVGEFEEIQATMDCWKANQKDLPALTSLAFKYAFLTGVLGSGREVSLLFPSNFERGQMSNG